MKDRKELAREAMAINKKIKARLFNIQGVYSLECKTALQELACYTKELASLFDEFNSH